MFTTELMTALCDKIQGPTCRFAHESLYEFLCMDKVYDINIQIQTADLMTSKRLIQDINDTLTSFISGTNVTYTYEDADNDQTFVEYTLTRNGRNVCRITLAVMNEWSGVSTISARGKSVNIPPVEHCIALLLEYIYRYGEKNDLHILALNFFMTQLYDINTVVSVCKERDMIYKADQLAVESLAIRGNLGYVLNHLNSELRISGPDFYSPGNVVSRLIAFSNNVAGLMF